MTDIYMPFMQVFYHAVIQTSLIYITSIRISSYISYNIKITTFGPLNKNELFFPLYSHYFRLFEPDMQ